MSLRELTSRDAVLEAIEEFDRTGRDAFLSKYGYGGSWRYRIVHEGREYDVKAIAGAAYGYQFPERGPLGRGEFGSGSRSTVPKLESLGFEVRARGPERAWLIRAGREGEYEDLALRHGVALIGWSELGDVARLSREDLKQAIRRVYGEERPRSLASQAGEIYRFIHDVRDGDLVVLPLRSLPGNVAVGRVAGGYEHREGDEWGPDARNTRPTEWLGSRAYEEFEPDIRQAFGQQGTVSEITKPDAAERILEGLEHEGAPPLDLVLKWSASREPRTIELHREVADRQGEVWWGRFTKDPSQTGMSARRLAIFEGQLARGEETFVFLHSKEATWRTRLRAITLDEEQVEEALVPAYYDPTAHRSLWVKLADFEQVDPGEIVRDYVLESNGEPVRRESLGNQGPLFVRRRVARTSSGEPEASAPFDADVVRARAEGLGLLLPEALYHQLVAALESGKHVILTGPPGTAKTTLAQALAEVAAGAGRCRGFLPTTATADWTTFETIGGLKPTGAETLEFAPGHFLDAIEADEWLLIDELNRSNFDRAFGQLFTVLSGQPVVLPYARGGGEAGPIVLLPEGASSPVGRGDELPIPGSWRIVATMNVFDKTLLFEMSFALMRRFAFIEVPSPPEETFVALIERAADGAEEAAELTGRLLELRDLKDLGPAVFMDISRYLARRVGTADGENGRLLFEAFYSYLLPQFEGIDSAKGEALFRRMGSLVGTEELRDRLRATLNAVLGLDLVAPTEDDGVESG